MRGYGEEKEELQNRLNSMIDLKQQLTQLLSYWLYWGHKDWSRRFNREKINGMRVVAVDPSVIPGNDNDVHTGDNLKQSSDTGGDIQGNVLTFC